MTESLHIRIDVQIANELRKLAKESDRTLNNTITVLLKASLADQKKILNKGVTGEI